MYINEQKQTFVNKDVVTSFFKKRANYESFVLNQAEYAKNLKNIEHVIID